MIRRGFNWLAGALLVVAALSVLMMMLHICADVASTFLIGMPIDGTLETTAGWYMVGVVFCSMAYVQSTGGHISVDLFTRRLPPRWSAALDAFNSLVSAGFLILLTWINTGEAIRRTATREVWETATGLLPVWPGRWAVPIGFGAMALLLLLRFTDSLRTAFANGAAGTLPASEEPLL